MWSAWGPLSSGHQAQAAHGNPEMRLQACQMTVPSPSFQLPVLWGQFPSLLCVSVFCIQVLFQPQSWFKTKQKMA